ncbi:hypothetical protein ACVJGD_000269 [Bradyrhizobium sp. USDA 10063]
MERSFSTTITPIIGGNDGADRINFLVTFALVGAARAQAPDPNPALNNPGKVSWELFAMLNKSPPGPNNNVVFETLAPGSGRDR